MREARPLGRSGLAAALAALLASAGCTAPERDEASAEPVAEAERAAEQAAAMPRAASPPASVRGTLVLSATGRTAPSGAILHHGVYVNGASYQGQEDNDLRGFLDGRFAFPWNQPTQSHVRAGRRQESPEFGETELFRVLYEWDALGLPREVEIAAARLELFLEKTALDGAPVTVLLYALKGEVEKGDGGIHRNNVDRPRLGEVWWGQRAYGRIPWGHPGASFASDVAPDADTGAHALAESVVTPGDTSLVFSSAALADAAERAARASAPLRLLLKLSDRDEDRRGSLIHLWSGNLGLDRDPARRPRLTLAWAAPGVMRSQRIHLEHGRTADIEAFDADAAAWVHASFRPEDGSEALRIEFRRAPDGDWTPAPARGVPGGARIEWRVSALRDPVVRGEAFVASFRDTWVTTGPEAEQRVPFVFVAPSGVRTEVPGRFVGDATWEVSFTPDELGRWQYRYAHALDQPYESEVAVFDCLPGDAAAIEGQLRALAETIDASGLEPHAAVERYGPELWQLERAIVRTLTPAERRGPIGASLDAAIVAVRNRLDTKPAARRLGRASEGAR